MMSTALILFIAALLDAALGEPRWLWDRLPHPAVVMGRCVDWFDQNLNRGTSLQLKGIITMVVLSAGAIGLGLLLQELGFVVEIIIVAILLAQRSLVDHVADVALALRQSVPAGRRAVSMIVGRDTSDMQAPDIARGAIESAAENFSDGVIAPAFWFLIAGLPGLLLYKITNTADSMIGYRTPRHEAFGWAAARLDDVLNVIPARLSAVFIAFTHAIASKYREIIRDAALHRSPNAGWPEAAMALALNVSLAGPRSYSGQMQSFPFVNEAGRKDIGATEIEDACVALWRSWGFAMAIVVLIAVVLG